MAIAMFLKVTGADGESKDAAHKGWSDIKSMHWGVSQPGSMATGGGGGTGKSAFHDLTVDCAIDKAMPSIMKHCASGKHLAEVKVSICKAGGTQIEYELITLSDVMVTEVNISGASDDANVIVHYAFQAARIKNEYSEQTAQGGKGATSQMGWNVKENVEM